jgi:hypothetical protein
MRQGNQHHHHNMLRHHIASGGIGSPPSLQALQQYDVLPSCTALFTDCLYDSLAYSANGQTQLQFFANQAGQVGGINGAKTYEDTNLDLGGMISKGTGFLVEQIEVEFQPARPTPANVKDMPAAFGVQQADNLINDAYVFGCAGWLEFKGPNNQTYLINGPMNEFSPSKRFSIDAALADISTAGANMQSRVGYGQWEGEPFNLHPVPVYLDSNSRFSVSLNWGTAVPLPSGVPGRVYVRLRGIRAVLGDDARHDPGVGRHTGHHQGGHPRLPHYR